MTAGPDRYAIPWRKGTASADSGDCVEVAFMEGYLLVRDSRDGSGQHLRLTMAQWRDLVRRIRAGDLSER